MVDIIDICPKQFKKKISLINHKNKNECDKYNKLPFKCSYCNKRYKIKKTLMKHEKNKHIENKNINKNIKKYEYDCMLCNKLFSTKSNLTKHLLKKRCPKLKNSSMSI